MLTFFIVWGSGAILWHTIKGLQVPYHMGNPKHEFYYTNEVESNLDMTQAALFMNIDE